MQTCYFNCHPSQSGGGYTPPQTPQFSPQGGPNSLPSQIQHRPAVTPTNSNKKSPYLEEPRTAWRKGKQRVQEEEAWCWTSGGRQPAAKIAATRDATASPLSVSRLPSHQPSAGFQLQVAQLPKHWSLTFPPNSTPESQQCLTNRHNLKNKPKIEPIPPKSNKLSSTLNFKSNSITNLSNFLLSS